MLSLGKVFKPIRDERWVQVRCLDPNILDLNAKAQAQRVLGSMLNKVGRAPKMGEHPTWAQASCLSPCPLWSWAWATTLEPMLLGCWTQAIMPETFLLGPQLYIELKLGNPILKGVFLAFLRGICPF